MAGESLTLVMPGISDKHIHPFFTHPSAQNDSQNLDSQTDDLKHLDDYCTDDEKELTLLDGLSERQPKRRKTEKPKARAEGLTEKGQRTLNELLHPTNKYANSRSQSPGIATSPYTTSSGYAVLPSGQGSKVDSEDNGAGLDNANLQSKPKPQTPINLEQDSESSREQELGLQTSHSVHDEVLAQSHVGKGECPTASSAMHAPPKKMLRLNAAGRFSSPISHVEQVSGELSTSHDNLQKPTKRGRPRKPKTQPATKQLVVRMLYKSNDVAKQSEFGNKIESILSKDKLVIVALAAVPKTEDIASKHPPRPPHPFFAGRKKAVKSKSPQPSCKVSTTTPGKLMFRTTNKDLQDDTSSHFISSLLKDRLMVKHVGAKEVAWPQRENAHVRGLTMLTTDAPPKSKATGKRVSKLPPYPHDSIIADFSKMLTPEPDPNLRADGFSEPHQSLRLPRKWLACRQDLASRIQSELGTVPNINLDELALRQPMRTAALSHATVRHFDALTEDKISCSTGESLPWTQKYAPKTSAEVLQPITKTRLITDWLKLLTVNATAINSDKLETKASKRDKALHGKRSKRKPEDLEDFLVDDDDILPSGMIEISDDEGTDGSHLRYHGLKSCVQSADSGKVLNAVLLVGPHGSGKTAAAYAAANELHFKVFEINSSERRSGRDILDKIGNMTENHLVKHHGTDIELSGTEDSDRWDEAFQKDLDSGRQGNLGKFFKHQQPGPEPMQVKKQTKAKKLEAIHTTMKRSQKEQKQSLILLEEVDILFREDKEFWSTVIKLVATSKRPCIMTCTDTRLIPTEALKFHAILRFTTPARDDAIDLMLLIAAREGHLLKREAVASIYQSKKHDLRASITEMNFWCQIGIGDPRSGLGWIFQRWPPGCDLDEHGRRLWVTSEDTFCTGTSSTPDAMLSCDDATLWAWSEYNIEPEDVFGWRDFSQLSASSLKDFEKFSASNSAMDVYSATRSTQPRMDTSIKPMNEKSVAQYIEGFQVLQTDTCDDYSDLSRQLRATTSRLLFNGLGKSNTHCKASLFDTLLNNNMPVDHVGLTRKDFTCFDPISEPEELSSSGYFSLQLSSFDRPLGPIATDLAPYIRSIVHYDMALEEQRSQLSGLDSSQSKRVRTTRAARSALEGSQRSSTRRERWFRQDLDIDAVLRTGGPQWPHLWAEIRHNDKHGSPGSPSMV